MAFQGIKKRADQARCYLIKSSLQDSNPFADRRWSGNAPCAILPSPYSAIILQLKGYPITAWNRRFTHCKLSKHIKLWGAWKVCTSTPGKLSAQSVSVLLVRRPYGGERRIRTPEPEGTELQSVAFDQLCYLPKIEAEGTWTPPTCTVSDRRDRPRLFPSGIYDSVICRQVLWPLSYSFILALQRWSYHAPAQVLL